MPLWILLEITERLLCFGRFSCPFPLSFSNQKRKKNGWSHFYGISLEQKVFFRSPTRTWPIPAKWIRTKCGTKKMVNWEFSAIMHPIKIISLCGKKIISVWLWILTKCNTISLEMAKNTKWNKWRSFIAIFLKWNSNFN